ncbi:MAG TPA: hypothetical protein VM657_03530 [Sphingomonas sp.]|nr:hypothetical protein [Sphingomonas sp.]
MRLLRFLSPFRAYRDLRLFMAQRHPHQLLFGFLSIALTALLIAGFYHDANIKKPYEKHIIYVEQWPANRSEAEILAQQKIDMKIKAKRMAEIEAAQEKRRATFQRIDNQLDAWGF